MAWNRNWIWLAIACNCIKISYMPGEHDIKMADDNMKSCPMILGLRSIGIEIDCHISPGDREGIHSHGVVVFIPIYRSRFKHSIDLESNCSFYLHRVSAVAIENSVHSQPANELVMVNIIIKHYLIFIAEFHFGYIVHIGSDFGMPSVCLFHITHQNTHSPSEYQLERSLMSGWFVFSSFVIILVQLCCISYVHRSKLVRQCQLNFVIKIICRTKQ